MTSHKSSSSQSPPPVGSYIDGGALQLVSVLGYGGYGVVYRAIDTSANAVDSLSYAVKCLIHSNTRSSSRQRRLHLQEIALHQRVSGHPHVVALHRVIEEDGFTFIVMDYCPDGDLFTQILHHRRYLGHDALIKHIFLQLLDAVGYCHSAGVYHRDLKPENVLCFNNGLRLALTDFGLATTDRVSEEFRTGSVYHMSPECQGGVFAPSGTYSTPYNDIWSLGIILLNLITGRNPWKSASASDPTFQAYLQDPANFLPSVLPISDEVNEILLQTLDVNWRSRITLDELREAIEGVHTFYADDVVFEGSMARCAWEAGADIPEPEPEEDEKPFVQVPPPRTGSELKSSWSEETTPEIDFAQQEALENDGEGWALYPPSRATWGADTALLSRSPSIISTALDGPSTPHSRSFSVYSQSPSDLYLSTRPEDGSVVAGDEHMASPVDPFAKGVNASFIVRSDSGDVHAAAENSSLYSSSFYVPSPVSPTTKPTYTLSAPVQVEISSYPRYEDDRQESMSWSQASYLRVPESNVRDDLSTMEFSQPTLEGSPIDTRPPWRSAPASPERARYAFPISTRISSPATTTTPFVPPSSEARSNRPKHRSGSFFLPIRLPFYSPSPAPLPNLPSPGPPPSYPVPPTPSEYPNSSSLSSPSPADAGTSYLVKSRRGMTGIITSATGLQERRRRRQPLRSARNWLLAGKRFAAAAVAA